MKLLKTENVDNTKLKMFLDDFGSVSVARYDKIKHKVFNRLADEQLSFFWRPEEVNLLKDQKDYRDLPENEKHIFRSVLIRQIVLDALQSRAPAVTMIPLTSLPELERWFITWSFFETTHNYSYTHIIRNVYADPSEIFDHIMDIQEVVDCCNDISKYYDDLYNYTTAYNFLGEGTHIVNGETVEISKYELKKRIWLCINSVNVLEGIRFYASFACSFAFAELKKMEGNAKIIRWINRDENIHLASTQMMIKLLPKDDEDFAKIALECEPEVIDMFNIAIEQEKVWAHYLFKNGSMIGMNAKILCEYIDYVGQQRMESIGLVPHKQKTNPFPWIYKWTESKTVQTANQETENTVYQIGDAKMDVDDNTFKGFTL